MAGGPTAHAALRARRAEWPGRSPAALQSQQQLDHFAIRMLFGWGMQWCTPARSAHELRLGVEECCTASSHHQNPRATCLADRPLLIRSHGPTGFRKNHCAFRELFCEKAVRGDSANSRPAEQPIGTRAVKLAHPAKRKDTDVLGPQPDRRVQWGPRA